MNRSLLSHDLNQKHVLLRLDLDVPLANGGVVDNTRLLASSSTIKYCLEHAQKTLIIGHLGRPKHQEEGSSLKHIQPILEQLLEQTISFVPDLDGEGQRWRSGTSPLGMLENLRFWPGEESNNLQFIHSLAEFGDIFVNDAFAVSHRHNASGTGVPTLLPSLIGPQLEAELKALDPIINNPSRPIIVIIGGSKTDKIAFVDNLLTQVDKVLVGGSIASSLKPNPKLVVASLTPDGLDINSASIDIFKSHIVSASTLIWNGPVGKYEDNLHGFHGTSQLAEIISTANAYKVAGGGDTLAVIHKLGLQSHFNHLSTGGGAMLYYIAHHTLPALEAILESPKP